MARGEDKEWQLEEKKVKGRPFWKGRKALTITAEENVPLRRQKILKEGDG